jgi:hypothetical protein
MGCRKKPANLSTGMTTSTHSSSNKTSTVNGARNGHKGDGSTKPLLSNSVSVSVVSSENGARKIGHQRSVAD